VAADGAGGGHFANFEKAATGKPILPSSLFSFLSVSAGAFGGLTGMNFE